ncbi:MAG: hypothetical protein NVS3B5_17320 [Sphingomicrobium sp.]
MRIEPETQRLVVGPRRALAVSAVRVEAINWIGEPRRTLSAKVRSLAAPVAAVWDGELLHFDDAQYGVSPGQSAVFYDDEQMLGGGTISATLSAECAVVA